MGKLIVLILFILCSVHSDAQDTTGNKSRRDTIIPVHPSRTIYGEFTDFTVDETGNILLVINNSQIKKLGPNGDSIAVFNDIKRYGSIHFVDASNPFRILVFYRSTATVLVLDRLLGVKQVIDLRRSSILQPKAVALSYDNNTWVFDELDNKIKKLGDNGKVVLESADLRNVFSEAPSFEVIIDKDRALYLYDPEQGWFEFDYYGAFKKKYAFPGWKDVHVLNRVLIGRDADSVFSVERSGFAFPEKKGILPKGLIKMHLERNGSYFLYPGKLEIYEGM